MAQKQMRRPQTTLMGTHNKEFPNSSFLKCRGLRTLEIESRRRDFTWKEGQTNTLFSLMPKQYNICEKCSWDGFWAGFPCCGLSFAHLSGWERCLQPRNAQGQEDVRPNTQWDQTLPCEAARVQGQRHATKNTTGACTHVLEDGFAGGLREPVWGVRRGGHAPWKFPCRGWSVALAQDKGLLSLLILSPRESWGPPLNEKKETHCKFFLCGGYSLGAVDPGVRNYL